jgi:hypothetical protein
MLAITEAIWERADCLGGLDLGTSQRVWWESGDVIDAQMDSAGVGVWMLSETGGERG